MLMPHGCRCAHAQVHHGFLSAYDSIRPQLLTLLDQVLEGEEQPWTLCLTGHSLGGALATLCAYDCALRRWVGAGSPAHPRLPPPRWTAPCG